MSIRELWDRYFWIVALVALEAVLLLSIFGLPAFCIEGEACGREMLGALSGWFSGAVTAISVVYLARQVAEARKQNDIAQNLQKRHAVNVTMRAYSAAKALKGTFAMFEGYASAQPNASDDLAKCIFRVKSALETIRGRFHERAFDEFENFHMCAVSIATIRRSVETSLETLESIYTAADAGHPSAALAYSKYLAQFNRYPYMGFLDEIVSVGQESLQENGVNAPS